jgi:dTDP-4-dehydrorhamnose reductase
LIHISTDCVFAGDKGNYTEQDIPDAKDLYGQSKRWGELIKQEHCITLRTSIIGLELANKMGLIEWFLSQKGIIKGFTHAIYSGFTTLEFSRIIEYVSLQYPNLHGLWHVSSDPINKYELLKIFQTKLQKEDVTIEPDNVFVCERSLNSENFRKLTGYNPPTWDNMLTELAEQVRDRGR